MRRWLLAGVLLALNLVLIEIGAATLLYHYWGLSGPQTVHGERLAPLATLELVREALARAGRSWPPHERQVLSSEPAPFYVLDPELGYTVRPGSYEVTIARYGRRYRFRVRVDEDGSRATSYRPSTAERHLYVFGDSVVWGLGVSDEHSFPWLLQQRFPEFRVRNLAQNGYGNIQALIHLRRLAPELGPDDVVLLTYAEYFQYRNAADPTWLRRVYAVIDEPGDAFAERLLYPVPTLTEDRIEIDYVELPCGASEGYCAGEAIPVAERARITERIIGEIIDLVPGEVVVAHLAGPDDDPMLDFISGRGVEIVDIRPADAFHEEDDLLPFDGHPGPLGQYFRFRKLEAHFAGRE